MKKTALLAAIAVLLTPVALFGNDVATGEKIFTEKKCGMCHGAKLEKKPIAKDEAAIVKFLTEDAKHKSKVAGADAAKALAAYIKSLKK